MLSKGLEGETTCLGTDDCLIFSTGCMLKCFLWTWRHTLQFLWYDLIILLFLYSSFVFRISLISKYFLMCIYRWYVFLSFCAKLFINRIFWDLDRQTDTDTYPHTWMNTCILLARTCYLNPQFFSYWCYIFVCLLLSLFL